MNIGQIKDGIVLDHITAGNGMNIYNVLNLGKLDCTVALIKNADSPKMGKKDIIKISTLLDLDLDVLLEHLVHHLCAEFLRDFQGDVGHSILLYPRKP